MTQTGVSDIVVHCCIRHSSLWDPRQVLLAPLRCCHHKPAIAVAALSKESKVWIKTAAVSDTTFKGGNQNSLVSLWPGGFVPLHHQIKRSHHLISRRMSSVPDKYLSRICDLYDQLQGFQSRVPPILFQSARLTGRNWAGGRLWWAWKIGQLCLRRVLDWIIDTCQHKTKAHFKRETWVLLNVIYLPSTKTQNQRIHSDPSIWNWTVKKYRIAVQTWLLTDRTCFLTLDRIEGWK